MKQFLTAEEAAKALGVSLETLYAYVSRGRVHSEPAEPGSRLRRYRADSVTALKEKRAYRRSPQLAAGEALAWGWPVLESQLTLIDHGSLYYRGRDACGLARTSTFEKTAAFFLNAPPEGFVEAAARGQQTLKSCPFFWQQPDAGLHPIAVLQGLLPYLDRHDPAAPVSASELMPSRAGDIVAAALAIVTGKMTSSSKSVAARLAAAWCPRTRHAERLIDAALILCIDHELNVSSFTARSVASSGASVYQAVAAGLAALQGWRHGGATLRVEALWDEVDRRRDVGAVLRDQRQQHGSIPGFGHRLYPQGDPRAVHLFRELEIGFRRNPQRIQAEALRTQGTALSGEPPSLDLALVAVSRCLKLPRQSALTLFALGRIVGWIAHATEQSRAGGLIRPRAKYTGPDPARAEKRASKPDR